MFYESIVNKGLQLAHEDGGPLRACFSAPIARSMEAFTIN